MASNGSFYQNGLPISTLENGVGNVQPGAPVPNARNSSFYLGGSVYATLLNSDALLAAITAQQAAATAEAAIALADATAAGISAVNAAASAAAAVITLGSDLKIANNLSDLGNLTTALVNLGLNNVNNTSDANKPVSTAQATADALVASNAAAATAALSSATTASLALKAPLASPALTGVPVAPTAAALNNSTQLATTAYADAATSALSSTLTTALALKAPLASPALTGAPTAPTAAALTNSTQLATTAYADAATAALSGTVTTALALKAPLASPALTGVPVAPTAAALTNNTQLATTAYADAATSALSSTMTTALALKAPLASPALTGVPTSPTATAGTNTTQLATTAFVAASFAPLAAPTFTGTVTSSGRLIVNDTTAATTTSDGSIATAGGISAAKGIIAGGPQSPFGEFLSVTTVSGQEAAHFYRKTTTTSDRIFVVESDVSFTRNGVMAVKGDGTITTQGSYLGSNTTDSTSTTTGSIQTTGGLGVSKSAWLGSILNVAGAATFQSAALSTSPSGGVGYATGAGGTVTQITSRTTGVTLNKTSGAITMFAANGSATAASFVVTNSSVAVTDTISLTCKSSANFYNFIVTAVAAGSFTLTFYTTGGTSLDSPVINFNVIKGVTS